MNLALPLLEYMGQTLKLSLLVKSCEFKTSQNDRSYWSAKLCDKHGEVTSVVWDKVKDLALVEEGQVIRGKFKVKEFNGKPQLDLVDLDEVLSLEDAGPENFIKTGVVPVDKWRKELERFLKTYVTDKDLQQLWRWFLDSEKVFNQFALAPAARSVHENWRGGLIDHTYSIMLIAEALGNLPHFSEVSLQMCLTGILFHDIGKVKDYEEVSPGVFEYTEYFYMESHLPISYRLLDRLCTNLKVPEEKALHLRHIVLAHHGIPEWGSAVKPCTPEAVLVHQADVTAARVATALEAEEGTYTRSNDTKIFHAHKGD